MNEKKAFLFKKILWIIEIFEEFIYCLKEQEKTRKLQTNISQG